MGGYVAVWILCGVFCFVIATSKGYSEILWPLLGLLFGPLALFVLLVLPKSEEQATEDAITSGELTLCPYCRETIKAGATKCKHCGSELQLATPKPDIDRGGHKRLQEAIYKGDTVMVKAIISSGLDLSENPLALSHVKYAELYGSPEIVEILAKN